MLHCSSCRWKWQALSDSADVDDELRYLHPILLERRRTETLVLGSKNSTAWSIARLARANFISRWDAAVMGKVPDALSNRLGVAIGKRAY